jgi:hypothetical protein
MEKSWWEEVAPGNRQDSIVSNTLSDLSAMTNISTTTSDPQPVPTPRNPIGITGDYECTAFKIPTILHGTVWSVLLTLLSEPEIIKRLPSCFADQPLLAPSPPPPRVPTPLPPQVVTPEPACKDLGIIWPTEENIYAIAGRKRMYFDGHRPIHYWVCDMLDGDRTWVPSGYLRSLNNWGINEMIEHYNAVRRGFHQDARIMVWRDLRTQVLPDPLRQELSAIVPSSTPAIAPQSILRRVTKPQPQAQPVPSPMSPFMIDSRIIDPRFSPQQSSQTAAPESPCYGPTSPAWPVEDVDFSAWLHSAMM